MEVAGPGDERLVVTLHANAGVEPVSALLVPLVRRDAEARFRVEARRAGHDADARFHGRIREREILAVADERSPRERRVCVIAAPGQAERRAVAAAANTQQLVPRPEHLLAVDLHRPQPPVVRIRRAEGIRRLAVRAAERHLGKEPPVGCGGAEHSPLYRAGADVFGRDTRRQVRFHGDRLRHGGRGRQGRRRQERGRHRQADATSLHCHVMSSGVPARTAVDPVRISPPGRQAW